MSVGIGRDDDLGIRAVQQRLVVGICCAAKLFLYLRQPVLQLVGDGCDLEPVIATHTLNMNVIAGSPESDHGNSDWFGIGHDMLPGMVVRLRWGGSGLIPRSHRSIRDEQRAGG